MNTATGGKKDPFNDITAILAEKKSYYRARIENISHFPFSRFTSSRFSRRYSATL